MSHSIHAGNGNRLLASLPAEDAAYLGSMSRVSRLPQGHTLTRRSVVGGDVWFPHTGVVALTVTDALGRSVQTGLIGSEGCIGLEAVLEPVSTLPEAIVQIEGPASVISASQLRTAALERRSIQRALSRFLYGLAAQSLHTIACNRLHSLLSRCCRWLLTFQDLVASDDLPLTQESLATLLGNGRPRVNRLLAGLERSGLLRRHRGRIHLLRRSGLEEQACDCYGAVRRIAASLDLLRT